MSLLDRIREANRHDFGDFVPWFVGARRAGCVRRGFAERLREWPAVFDVQAACVRLCRELDAATPAKRTRAVAEVCEQLRARGEIEGWRDELYPVTSAWGTPPDLLMERAAVPHFGVTAYGVHINGFVSDAGAATHMWVARRSLSKPTGPGKLDQIVAGGQPHDIGLLDNVIKECGEEAGIPAALARHARPVGAITYLREAAQGMRPDVIFNFDLQLPPEFEPENRDGEVDAFYLWPLTRVHETLAGSDAYKFNCALVAIDFLLRHGHVNADERDYQALVLGLLPDIDNAPAAWSALP